MSDFPVTNGVTTFLPPPDGYVVDFDNPQQQKALEHYMVFGILGSLAFLCLAQRLYTKQFISGKLTIDDGLMFCAWLASLAMQSVQTWSISLGGLCHHTWEMPIEVYEKHMLSSYIVAPIFITCNGFSKTSLLTFYLQISPQKYFKIAIWATIVLVICYTLTIAGLLLFGCQPIRASWEPELLGTGRCVNQAIMYIAIAVANIVSDCILFVIPIPTIVRLKMPVQQKIGAGVMFGIGSVTVATSIVRLCYLPSLLEATDIPWVAAPANVWSFVEVNLFIICGSMPTFRKFIKRFAPRLMGSSTGPSKSSGYDLSHSKLPRQQRTGYSQFEDVEMFRFADTKSGKNAEIRTTVMCPEEVERSRKDKKGDVLHTRQDNSSEDTILSPGAIAYTKTFDVQYSS